MRLSNLSRFLLLLAVVFFSILPVSFAVEAPKLVEKDGRWALFVEGRPYLILGGQIHNSSSWPSELPQVWTSFAALHANTVEAPVYWEQIEAQQGQFNFDNVDLLVKGAREHGLHVVLLWFGTWKNGNMHYVPKWVKTDPKRFSRVINPGGEPVDVLSANSRVNLEADKAAFAALMRHLKGLDGDQHTVLMVQVENESGNIGTVRDFSAEANAAFAGQVPADLLAIVKKKPGTWSQVFGSEADETFQAYHQAHYVNEIAAAGKAEFAIPLCINVWRGLAPSVDMIGPDIYSPDSGFALEVMSAYTRPDNPLWIPETGRNDEFAKLLFYALGQGAIGFSPFGVDSTGWNSMGDDPVKAHAENFALLGPMNREIAKLNFEGKLKTSVEEPGRAQQELDFGTWQATVSFGFPQYDGRRPPGTKDAHGVALVAQLGPDEFLVTGIDASVSFHVPGRLPGLRMQILSAEQGSYDNGVWKPLRLWNGDETDRGLSFHHEPTAVRVQLGTF